MIRFILRYDGECFFVRLFIRLNPVTRISHLVLVTSVFSSRLRVGYEGWSRGEPCPAEPGPPGGGSPEAGSGDGDGL